MSALSFMSDANFSEVMTRLEARSTITGDEDWKWLWQRQNLSPSQRQRFREIYARQCDSDLHLPTASWLGS